KRRYRKDEEDQRLAIAIVEQDKSKDRSGNRDQAGVQPERQNGHREGRNEPDKVEERAHARPPDENHNEREQRQRRTVGLAVHPVLPDRDRLVANEEDRKARGKRPGDRRPRAKENDDKQGGKGRARRPHQHLDDEVPVEARDPRRKRREERPQTVLSPEISADPLDRHQRRDQRVRPVLSAVPV